MPRASLRSLLFGCALRNALVWRVSMQMTGSPALARPSNSHCDRGPVRTERRLRDAHPRSRAIEMQLLGDRDEVRKLAQFHVGSEVIARLRNRRFVAGAC